MYSTCKNDLSSITKCLYDSTCKKELLGKTKCVIQPRSTITDMHVHVNNAIQCIMHAQSAH